MKFGNSLATSILVSTFPLRPQTRCCTLPSTGSTLLRCSYIHHWSRLKCLSVRWWRRLSKGPFVRIENFFLHIWHQTICGLWTGSAGPKMNERVHPILAKISSRIGTPLLLGLLFLFRRFCLEEPCV